MDSCLDGGGVCGSTSFVVLKLSFEENDGAKLEQMDLFVYRLSGAATPDDDECKFRHKNRKSLSLVLG